MLTLYFAPGSSSFAPHIALNEIGVPYEQRPLSFDKKETRSPAYLAINPEGKVPTLLIDARPLTEVAAILFYLARTYPAAQLLPFSDPEGEARAISWMSFIASTLHPARNKGIEHTRNVYDIADKRLGTKEWVLGPYSIVDFHLFRLYWRLMAALDLPQGALPNLAAHHARMMARPAVQRTCAIEKSVGYEMPEWFAGQGTRAPA